MLQALVMGAWLLPLPHCGPWHCLLGVSQSSGQSRLQGTVSEGKACLGERKDAVLLPSSFQLLQALPCACKREEQQWRVTPNACAPSEHAFCLPQAWAPAPAPVAPCKDSASAVRKVALVSPWLCPCLLLPPCPLWVLCSVQPSLRTVMLQPWGSCLGLDQVSSVWRWLTWLPALSQRVFLGSSEQSHAAPFALGSSPLSQAM